MLTCIPQSLFSWDFRVEGADAGPADLTFNFFTEQGSISLGPIEYEVRKHGPFSGHWTLERDGEVVAEARKPSAMFRSFEVSAGGLELTVQARSAFGRSFEIVSGGEVVGTIRPANAFTRRTSIECSDEVPFLIRLFSFWLAVITWRRSRRNNSNN